MSSISAFTAPALKLSLLATTLGRYGTLLALGIGVIGWWRVPKDPREGARFRTMAISGGAGYILITAIDVVYAVLRYILGSTFLPAGWPYGGVTGAAATDLTSFAIALSSVLYALGLTMFIIGVTWWAVGRQGSRADLRGRRSIIIGLTLLGASIGGNVFSVLAWIVQ